MDKEGVMTKDTLREYRRQRSSITRRTEMPELQQFYDKYRNDKSVSIFTISNDKDLAELREWMAKRKLTIPTLFDDGFVETVESAYVRFCVAFNVTGVPALSLPCCHDRMTGLAVLFAKRVLTFSARTHALQTRRYTYPRCRLVG